MIREDPHNRDLLFVGSSRTVYVSIDRGQTWTQVRDELPDGAGVRSADSSARPRADRGDARPQPLDRRHRGARADDAEGRRAGHVSLQAEDGVSSGAKVRSSDLPGNGFAQAVMTYANPPYGADIVYRLAAAAPGTVRLVVSDAAGDTLATIERSGRARACITSTGTSRKRAARRARPSCRRRSDVTAFCCARARRRCSTRCTKAGYDTAAIRVGARAGRTS